MSTPNTLQIVIRRHEKSLGGTKGEDLSLVSIGTLERDAAGISGKELSSRMSLFLWFAGPFEKDGETRSKILRCPINAADAVALRRAISTVGNFFERNHRGIPLGADVQQAPIPGITVGITKGENGKSEDFIEFEDTDTGKLRIQFKEQHALSDLDAQLAVHYPAH